MDKSGFEVKTCAKFMQKNMRISKKKQKHEKYHQFFAAGACSQKKVQQIMNNMRISRKS